MIRSTAIAALLAAAALPALAGHANTWAADDVDVLSQFHDENQAQSVDTPGEDEMNGVMERRSYGKLGGAAMDVARLDGRDGGSAERDHAEGAGRGEGGGHGEGGGDD